MSSDLGHLITKQLPDATIVISYGATETGSVVSVTPSEASYEVRVSSVGYTIPNVELKVVDPETGRMLPLGQKGELLARSMSNMIEYYKEPEKTANVLKHGWYKTGYDRRRHSLSCAKLIVSLVSL